MKPYRYLLLATLSLSLFACTNGEDVDPVVPVDPNAPAALSVQIAGVALTKAGATTRDISEISLYAVNNVSGETSYGTLPNGTYGEYTTTSSDGTSFAPTNESNTIWLNNQVAKIYACYPVGTITAGGTSGSPTYTIPVPTSAITLAPTSFIFTTSESTTKALDFTTPANDYMYGVTYTASPATFGTDQPTASNRTPSVSIGMKHAFSQIRLLINKADNYQGTPVITNVSLACKQPFLQDGSTMSLANGALSNLTTPGGGATDYNVTYTYSLTTNSVTIDGSSVATLSITNYILPSTEGIPYKITITADGKAMELSGTTQKLDAGKINTYTISINGAGLNLSGFQIVSWDNVDVNVEEKL